MSDDKKIIFSMVGVGKATPSGKQILKDIYLSFFYGAKIGVLGMNGSGKSSLLNNLMGEDHMNTQEISTSTNKPQVGAGSLRKRDDAPSGRHAGLHPVPAGPGSRRNGRRNRRWSGQTYRSLTAGCPAARTP